MFRSTSEWWPQRAAGDMGGARLGFGHPKHPWCHCLACQELAPPSMCRLSPFPSPLRYRMEKRPMACPDITPTTVTFPDPPASAFSISRSVNHGCPQVRTERIRGDAGGRQHPSHLGTTEHPSFHRVAEPPTQGKALAAKRCFEHQRHTPLLFLALPAAPRLCLCPSFFPRLECCLSEAEPFSS